MRHPILKAPDYPPFVLGPNVPPAAAEALRPLISHGARHDAHNGFEAEGSEKYGRPARHRLARIHVGDAFEGVPEAETRTGSVHVLFETEEGERFGINRCKPGYRPTPQEGILLKDRHGRAWFCEEAPADGVVQTRQGEGRLRPVPLSTAPRLRDAQLQGAELADRIPAAGRFLLGPQDLILGVEGAWGIPDAGALALAEARVERLVAREDRIRAIAERHLQPGALDGLKIGRDYPITDGFIPPIMRLTRIRRSTRPSSRSPGPCLRICDRRVCSPPVRIMGPGPSPRSRPGTAGLRGPMMRLRTRGRGRIVGGSMTWRMRPGSRPSRTACSARWWTVRRESGSGTTRGTGAASGRPRSRLRRRRWTRCSRPPARASSPPMRRRRRTTISGSWICGASRPGTPLCCRTPS